MRKLAHDYLSVLYSPVNIVAQEEISKSVTFFTWYFSSVSAAFTLPTRLTVTQKLRLPLAHLRAGRHASNRVLGQAAEQHD